MDDEPETTLSEALPLLAGGFAILFVVVGGGIDTASVFLNALASDQGWSLRALSVGVSVGAVSAALATPGVGWLIDRFGVRVPMVLGLALLAVGFTLLSCMRESWHFVAANVLLGPGFAGAALLPIPVAVTMTVRARTALALGIVTVGSSAGALLLAPALQLGIDWLGWRGTYALLGGAVVATPLPFLLLALPRGRLGGGERDPSLARPARRELGRPGVPTLVGLLVLPGLVGFGIQVHLVPYLADLGHSTGFAASALGAAIGVAALGKLGGGWIGDRLGALPTLRLALGLKVLAVLLLAAAATPWLAGAFVVAHGLAGGAQAAVVPVLALTVLGRERFATLFGLVQFVAMLAVGLGPLVPGFVFEASGSYAGALCFWLAALLAALALTARLGRVLGPAAASSAPSGPTTEEPGPRGTG